MQQKFKKFFYIKKKINVKMPFSPGRECGKSYYHTKFDSLKKWENNDDEWKREGLLSWIASGGVLFLKKLTGWTIRKTKQKRTRGRKSICPSQKSWLSRSDAQWQTSIERGEALGPISVSTSSAWVRDYKAGEVIIH